MDEFINKRFARLKVLKSFHRSFSSGRKLIFFKCICICGNIKDVYKHSLVKGYTRSCGCLRKEESAKRMKKNNPVWMKGVKEKIMITNKMLGTRPMVRGGNGKEMSAPQRILLSALGNGWYGEHSVATHLRKISKNKYPTCYKIDIANPGKKIAIEVDGSSHSALERQKQDRKKTLFLEKNGWTVYRFKNKEVMTNLTKIINAIAF